MKETAFLIFCAAFANCAKVETASNDNTQNNASKIAAVSPVGETKATLKTVTPEVKLNAVQQKYLNKSLPPQIREILEKAEVFEVLAELGKQKNESDLMELQPNVNAKIDSENIKKMILESFYADVATDEGGANCYEPRHGLHAVYQEKTVDIEICFACAKFNVKSSLGTFEGTIRRDNRRSENLLNEIVVNFGNLIK